MEYANALGSDTHSWIFGIDTNDVAHVLKGEKEKEEEKGIYKNA